MVAVRVLGHPDEVLDRAPVPELVGHELAINGVDGLVLVDRAAGVAWEAVHPLVSDSALAAERLTRLPLAEALALPALGGSLSSYDLEHPGRRAVAIGVPASALTPGGARLGDRMALADHAVAPDGDDHQSPAEAALIAILSSHGGRIIGIADQPTLYVDRHVRAEAQAALTAALRRLVPSLRLVADDAGR